MTYDNYQGAKVVIETVAKAPKFKLRKPDCKRMIFIHTYVGIHIHIDYNLHFIIPE